jgi:hypothetical protein
MHAVDIVVCLWLFLFNLFSVGLCTIIHHHISIKPPVTLTIIDLLYQESIL